MASPPAQGGARDLLAQPVHDYASVEALLLSRVRDDPRPYRDRAPLAGRAVRGLLSRAGVSLDGIRFLHIAGSKGKGSVALLAEHLLRDRGEPTGTYTSPHLRRWNERVRIDGGAVGDAALAAALDTLRPHVAALDALGDEYAPTFFDLITAVGLLILVRSGCRVVALETGMGGRFDATNVVTPAACCITSIEHEHTDKLGATLAEIAWHKAGIIKAGAPVVTGDLDPEPAAVVAAHAAAAGSTELRLGRDWQVQSDPLGGGRQRVRISSTHPDAPLRAEVVIPRPGRHMAVNAGLALMLTRAAGYAADAASLAHCELPGRCQILAQRPWVVVDGAHTVASLRALAETLDGIAAGERHFLVSVTRGKQPATLAALAALLSGARRVVVTQADPLRSATAGELGHALACAGPELPLVLEPDPGTALARARAELTADGLLCVCGSVYLAGFALGQM